MHKDIKKLIKSGRKELSKKLEVEKARYSNRLKASFLLALPLFTQGVIIILKALVGLK